MTLIEFLQFGNKHFSSSKAVTGSEQLLQMALCD
jgi:hypothetical protein